MAEHRFPDVHGPVEESAWEGGGRTGLENYREHERHHAKASGEEPLGLSDEEIEDQRRPAPGHWAVTPGAMGPTTRDVGTVTGAAESAIGKTEVAGPL